MAAGHLMDQTFQVTGPNIWNVLPEFIRNIDGEDLTRFKTALDSYLMNLEDVPRVGSYKMRKNSLIGILGLKKLDLIYSLYSLLFVRCTKFT